MEKGMKIAIIGGGKRCRAFLEMFDARRFPNLRAEIVAVADPNPEAAGIRLAREKNIPTTTDYKSFYAIEDLDLVIELTGNEELLEDFLRNKPANVRVLEATISRILGDVLRLREEYLFNRRHIDQVEGIINSLFLSMREWVLLLQPDFKLLDANDAFLDATGTSKEEIIGKLCYRAAYGLEQHCGGEGFSCPVRQSLESGAVAHAILENNGPDNSVRYHEITAVPLKGRDGRIQLVVECFRDITGDLERRVEQKVLSLKQDLMRIIHEEKMISLGKLAAGAVHEINNPLAGINSLARLMQAELESEEIDPTGKEKFLHYLSLISSESSRCSGIVKDLLQFSRQARGIQTSFQLNELVLRAMQLVDFRLKAQKIQVRTGLEELPEFTGDRSQIQQCLLNLIFNAIDAMPDGGELAVETSWNRSRGEIRLEIADSGPGVPKEIVSRIFEPFFSTKSRDKGVGLGLSVVYGIVKEHGGSIFVRSKEGEGARFIVRFPVTPGRDKGENYWLKK
ncbi:MAG: ATP-binding protein [Syntrophobacteraceae bacterium]